MLNYYPEAATFRFLLPTYTESRINRRGVVKQRLESFIGKHSTRIIANTVNFLQIYYRL